MDHYSMKFVFYITFFDEWFLQNLLNLLYFLSDSAHLLLSCYFQFIDYAFSYFYFLLGYSKLALSQLLWIKEIKIIIQNFRILIVRILFILSLWTWVQQIFTCLKYFNHFTHFAILLINLFKLGFTVLTLNFFELLQFQL
jgi:hypothetical protein